MDRVQLKLLELLDEIDGICQEVNIGYTLSPQTAAMGQVCGGFAEENYNVTIYMTTNDYLNFAKYVDQNKLPGRILEGLHNNPNFPGFFFRYVNTETTYYNYNYGDTYLHNGIHVTIEILRYYSRSNNQSLVMLEKGLAHNSYRYKKWLKLSNKINRLKVALKFIGGKAKATKKIYARLKRSYLIKKPFVTFYCHVNRFHFSRTKYPSYLYTRRKQMAFEDRMYYVASDLSLQYQLITGKSLENHEPITGTYGFSMLISTEVPYREHFQNQDLRKKIIRKRQELWLTDQMHGTVTHFMNRDWDIMKCVSARLDMKAKYLPLKNDIIQMYRDEEFESLQELFVEYDELIRYYYVKSKMTLYFDKEIFDIYLAWLESNGEYVLAKKLVRKIPDAWKRK